MKTFYDFLENKRNSIFYEQNPIIDPIVGGFLQGSGVTPELEKIGNRLGVGAKNIVKKTGQGIGRAVFGQKNNSDLTNQKQSYEIDNVQQISGGGSFREIRTKYFDLQNALKNYYNVISNNPYLKKSNEFANVQKMLEKIEDELESTYFVLSQLEKKNILLNQPKPIKGKILP